MKAPDGLMFFGLAFGWLPLKSRGLITEEKENEKEYDHTLYWHR